MLSNPRYSMQTRSSPIPPPACGGHPNRKESMYALIVSKSVKANIDIILKVDSFIIALYPIQIYVLFLILKSVGHYLPNAVFSYIPGFS